MVFLACSSEWKEDRKEFEIFINQKNNDRINKEVFFELIRWEELLDGLSKTLLQDEYSAMYDADVIQRLGERLLNSDLPFREFYDRIDPEQLLLSRDCDSA